MNKVRDAGLKGLDRKYNPWNLDLAELPAEAERARCLFAELIGASSDDIAIVGSTSYGIEIAARNIELNSGQEIVILQDQFPSNVYSWRN